jgi:hypothetical protein
MHINIDEHVGNSKNTIETAKISHQWFGKSNDVTNQTPRLDQNKPQNRVLGLDQSLIQYQFIGELRLHREIQSLYLVLGIFLI